MPSTKYLLSVTSSVEGDYVTIHGNISGLQKLRNEIDLLLSKLQANECDHDHLRTQEWAGHELTCTMLAQEQDTGHRTVHHLELFAWTDEWQEKHGL